MRTGADYRAALDDGRTVYVDGERVKNVADHPAFAGVVETMAGIYDASCEPGSVLVDPETGELAIFTTPYTAEQHERRKVALEEWSRLSHGFIGRGPDHVAGLLAGFASRPEVFDTEERALGANVVAYRRRAAAEGLWLANSIVPPQMNPADPTSRVRPVELVAVSAEGIVVDGAQMLGTGAAVADAVFVTSVRPLGPTETARALSFVVPINAPGLSLLCRRPYASAGEPFDYPLANRFDETDAMMVFDQVFVPWSDVFAAGSVEAVNAQFFGTAAHQIGNLQSILRLSAKLRFVTGIASRILAANGRDKDMALRGQLAEIATIQTVTEALAEMAHRCAAPDAQGVWRPEGKYLYAALGQQTEVYPRAVKLLGELVGGGVIQVPSHVSDFDNPDEVAAMDVVMGSDQLPVVERVKLFKLAWDVVGSEFAGRHVQYERFYSGNAMVVKGYAYRHYPFAEAEGLVADFLAGYGAGVAGG
ncbi:4-hydroxyphenylacetate 3-hydroxylase N-terminal domain-containing protein [Nocardioides sp.]|uniref:4-hydroxyphenylacetate 3-hydroxylase family protein n=1 Tax=Nocardioides sp. TaxID=35761 RepID=UPI002639FA3B|nr:4-hydroxyphenylacetate 3-hydroxylase N-terminal domain-containing protein [Nocardioides sp.]